LTERQQRQFRFDFGNRDKIPVAVQNRHGGADRGLRRSDNHLRIAARLARRLYMRKTLHSGDKPPVQNDDEQPI
jgi:hypothetical protein